MTSTPLTEASHYIQCALYFNLNKYWLLGNDSSNWLPLALGWQQLHSRRNSEVDLLPLPSLLKVWPLHISFLFCWLLQSRISEKVCFYKHNQGLQQLFLAEFRELCARLCPSTFVVLEEVYEARLRLFELTRCPSRAWDRDEEVAGRKQRYLYSPWWKEQFFSHDSPW